MNPKICIVFNGGAAGDFFATLVSQQISDHKEIINDDGTVVNPVGHSFKMTCQEFYKQKFDTGVFSQCELAPVVNTHYCYQELIDLFPNCDFYYIDDSDYIDITVESYIKKRVLPAYDNLLDWAHSVHNFLQLTKINNLTDDQIKIIMKNDWRKNLNTWKALNIKSINLKDIINVKTCCKIVEYMLQSTIDIDKLNQTHSAWVSKNSQLINDIKYKL